MEPEIATERRNFNYFLLQAVLETLPTHSAEEEGELELIAIDDLPPTAPRGQKLDLPEAKETRLKSFQIPSSSLGKVSAIIVDDGIPSKAPLNDLFQFQKPSLPPSVPISRPYVGSRMPLPDPKSATLVGVTVRPISTPTTTTIPTIPSSSTPLTVVRPLQSFLPPSMTDMMGTIKKTNWQPDTPPATIPGPFTVDQSQCKHAYSSLVTFLVEETIRKAREEAREREEKLRRRRNYPWVRLSRHLLLTQRRTKTSFQLHTKAYLTSITKNLENQKLALNLKRKLLERK